jgi:hypothetical protein
MQAEMREPITAKAIRTPSIGRTLAWTGAYLGATACVLATYLAVLSAGMPHRAKRLYLSELVILHVPAVVALALVALALVLHHRAGGQQWTGWLAAVPVAVAALAEITFVWWVAWA